MLSPSIRLKPKSEYFRSPGPSRRIYYTSHSLTCSSIFLPTHTAYMPNHLQIKHRYAHLYLNALLVQQMLTFLQTSTLTIKHKTHYYDAIPSAVYYKSSWDAENAENGKHENRKSSTKLQGGNRANVKDGKCEVWNNSAAFVRFALGVSVTEGQSFDWLWNLLQATMASMQMTKGTMVWISNYYTNYSATCARSIRTTSQETFSIT